MESGKAVRDDPERDAEREQQTLVTVASIFPPNCKIISKNVGARVLQPGQITFVVMARNATRAMAA